MGKAARRRVGVALAPVLALVSLSLVACGSAPGTGAGESNAGGSSRGGTGGGLAGTGGASSGNSTGGGPSSPAVGGAGGGNAGAGGSAGAGSGGAGAGGTGQGGSAGSGGSTADAGGGSDSAGAGAGDGAAGPASGFSCTLFVGPSPMMQWFRGGFLEQPGIDAAKYQLIWVPHHYTDAWGTPGDSAWNTALDQGHACAQNAMMPDRVAFMATQWSHTTAAQWEKDLGGIVENIKKKWPAVKQIELMASTSAPGNKPCPAAGGKNNETIIPAFGYEAIDAMPAKFPGLVVALPHFEVPNCSDFIGNGTQPQYAPNANATTGPAVMDVAKVFGAYYVQHP